MNGRFLLNYSISSANPVASSVGELIIVIDLQKFGIKSITLNDIITGEELYIEFDLPADKMEINGGLVKRFEALESNKDQFVFVPFPGKGQKMYHLSRQQIEKMKILV